PGAPPPPGWPPPAPPAPPLPRRTRAGGSWLPTRMMVGLGALAVLAVAAAVMAALGVGGDDHDRPAAGSTITPTAPAPTITSGDPDEAAAETAVRGYFQAVLDKDCPAMIRLASQTVWGADNPGDVLAGCQQALARTDYKARGYSLDGLKVKSHQGDTVAFTT